MKTKLFTFFLALVASAGTIFADGIQIGDLYYNLNYENKTAEVTYKSYNSSFRRYNEDWDISVANIPAYVEYRSVTYDVTNIGEHAFEGCSKLTYVTIGNNVTSIKNQAFNKCYNLTSVEISNSVTSIGPRAFLYCSGLTSVTIPTSVTSIGYSAFYDCVGLTSLVIPNNVTSIEGAAFQNVSNIVYYGNATGSPWGARCVNGIVEGDFIFQDETKKNLVRCSTTAEGEMIIPQTVTRIESYAFYLCKYVTRINIPNSVTGIGVCVFQDCTGLTSIDIPNSITNIVSSTFLNCTNLTSVTIPNSVTSIGQQAFQNCIGLASIAIPNSVISIGSHAFSGCTSLSSVVWNVKKYNDFSNTATPFYNTNPSFDLRSQITSFVFGPDVEHVPAYICSGMSNLKKVSIGANVKTIGAYAFKDVNARGFRAITLPFVQTIEESAFDGCSYLETIDFGANLESIGSSAFKGCTRVSAMTCLADITPDVEKDGLTSISEQAELYVLKDCVQKYKVDENWNRFTIKEKTAESTDVTALTIIPEESTASIAWPAISGAATYELVIKDQESKEVCTLIFNSAGQLTSIAFNAPSRDGAPQHTQTAGFTFTITGLEAGTEYNLTITAKNASGQEIDKKNSSFHTNWPNGIENLHVDSAKPVKVLMDGQIYILRGEHIYDAAGKMVK